MPHNLTHMHENDYHNNFSEHSSSHTDTNLKKYKKVWWELLGFTS